MSTTASPTQTPARQPRGRKPANKALQAVKIVVDALEPLSPEDRNRTLATVMQFLETK